MMSEKEKDILAHGIMSIYWKEYTDSLPWGNESAETKLFVAGMLKRIPQHVILRIMAEQKDYHGGNFKNMGFFIWTEFFDGLSNAQIIDRE